jgi:hypothetical protein
MCGLDRPLAPDLVSELFGGHLFAGIDDPTIDLRPFVPGRLDQSGDRDAGRGTLAPESSIATNHQSQHATGSPQTRSGQAEPAQRVQCNIIVRLTRRTEYKSAQLRRYFQTFPRLTRRSEHLNQLGVGIADENQLPGNGNDRAFGRDSPQPYDESR